MYEAFNDSNGWGSHFHQIGTVRKKLELELYQEMYVFQMVGGERGRDKESVTRKVELWDS